jgi:ligand-binding sensor domain-containing protein
MGVCQDKSGNLWFGTYGGGVSRLDRDGKTFTNYTTAQGLASNVVRSNIAEDKMGNLWFGTGGGICQLDPAGKVFKIYTTLQGLPQNNIRCITEDKTGNLWFGTSEGGVSRLDQNKKTITTYTTDQGLSNNSIRSITEDKAGNLWFSTLGGGVSRLDQDRKSFTNYTTVHGLANNYSWPMLGDKNGNLWIGTEVGVSRYDGKSFMNYTTSDGLPNNEIEDIVMDKEGTIWVGTDRGITALTGFAGDDVNIKPSNKLSNAEIKNAGFKPVFETYNNKTGDRIKGINPNAMYVTREGIIWAGTGGFLGDKLISFNFSNIQKNPTPPVIFIQGLKINNEPVSWYNLIAPGSHQNSHGKEGAMDSITTLPNITEEGTVIGKILKEEQRKAMREKFGDVKFDSITRFYPLPLNLVLPYRHNNLTFDFVAIEPARPFLVRYQYMLEGYDKEWSPVTDQTYCLVR